MKIIDGGVTAAKGFKAAAAAAEIKYKMKGFFSVVQKHGKQSVCRQYRK